MVLHTIRVIVTNVKVELILNAYPFRIPGNPASAMGKLKLPTTNYLAKGLNSVKIRNPLVKECLAEMLGNFVMLAFGDAVVAQVSIIPRRLFTEKVILAGKIISPQFYPEKKLVSAEGYPEPIFYIDREVIAEINVPAQY